MELFTQLFGSFLDFVYHCFDRMVINGYLSGLSPRSFTTSMHRKRCARLISA